MRFFCPKQRQVVQVKSMPNSNFFITWFLQLDVIKITQMLI
jgi:hypothetical protein